MSLLCKVPANNIELPVLCKILCNKLLDFNYLSSCACSYILPSHVQRSEVLRYDLTWQHDEIYKNVNFQHHKDGLR